MSQWKSVLLLLTILCSWCVWESASKLIADTSDYTIWRIPDNANEDLSGIVTQSGLALIGGGENCDEAFAYMITHANGGDFVVLRASSDDSYNDYIYDLSQSINATVHSVTTIKLKSRTGALSTIVAQYLQQAEAVFIAGGDQSVYLRDWRNTPVQSILQQKIQQQVTIGGTSAGLAIQGTYIYSAASDTVYSDEAMENPYNIFMTLDDQFLSYPNFERVLTDTHFVKRDRMGRMLTFLARSELDLQIPSYRTLGVDEESALLLDVDTGIATTVGKGIGGFICQSTAYPEVCKAERPLEFYSITCHRVSSQARDTFDFVKNRGSGVTYSLKIVNGHIEGNPYGP